MAVPVCVDILELIMLVAHRSRLAFEESCASDEFVAHEVLLLRALLRIGQNKTGRELARALGWSPGRVTQVIDALVAKDQVVRAPRRGRIRPLSINGRGANEASGGVEILRQVGDVLVAGLDEAETRALREALKKLAERSEGLWRIKRNVDGS
jgi:DNA-binding MarR family transcriptional regulator